MSIRKTVQLAGGRLLHLSTGDIREEPVDAIVNAANSQLAHGGGVAAAISSAAGPALDEESLAWVRDHGPVPTGEAAVTTAGRLPFKGVIHAVGPRASQPEVEAKLVSAVAAALARAHERQWRSIAIPGISSGIFGVPAEICARAYIQGVLHHLAEHPDSTLAEIRFTLWLGAQGGDLVRFVEREMAAIASGDGKKPSR